MNPRTAAAYAAAVVAVLNVPLGTGVVAADLHPKTIAAFERYVALTEARLQKDPAFLWIESLPASRRQQVRDQIRRNELAIERLTTRDGSRDIDVPDGMIHHWIGTAFVSGATIDQALTILQSYDKHQQIYAPTVAASKMLAHDGDRFRFFLRFMMKKVITVVVNSEHEARFRRPAADRAEGWIASTRIAEVENPGTPDEREKPVGHDGGYLWRLNTYWRLLARDGGLYIQCESVSLTRGIPIGLGWVVGPFVTSIPRESLTFTLDTTRRQLEGARR
ncbi:MAG TPA: hypothetical protein VKB50_13710 [Vicinamibacterales bacterium]|nr:hypothetical protein [Vicinamibacterales bacterium]